MANPVAVFYDLTGVTPVNSQVPGSRFEGDVEISLIGVTYVTNGLTVASLLASLGFTVVTHFFPICLGPSLDATVNDMSYDKANGKVKLYAAQTPAEIANGQDLSAYKIYARVGGRR